MFLAFQDPTPRQQDLPPASIYGSWLILLIYIAKNSFQSYMYIYAAQELWIKFSAKDCAAQYKHTEWLMLVKLWNANNDSPYLACATEQSGIRSVQYQRSFGCKDWFCSKFTSSKEMQIPNEATNSIKMKVYPFENGQNETLPHWALASLQAQEQLHILSACTSSYSLWQHQTW